MEAGLSRAMPRSRRFDDLARAQAAGADAKASDAAVHNRTHGLQIRLEPAPVYVVRVADGSADHWSLVTNFTSLGHVVSRYWMKTNNEL